MPNVLIVGATRGLGASLANQYATHPSTTVYGTTRSAEPPKGKGHNEGIKWAKGIDLNEAGAGKKLVEELGAIGLKGGLDVVVSCASIRNRGVLLTAMADHNSRLLRNRRLRLWSKMGGGGSDVVCLPPLFC